MRELRKIGVSLYGNSVPQALIFLLPRKGTGFRGKSESGWTEKGKKEREGFPFGRILIENKKK